MIKAAIKSLLLMLWILFAMAVLWLGKKIGRKADKANWPDNICKFGFAGINRIIGLRVKVEGDLASGRPLLVVSNHISYLDIMILGAKTTARFTPKSEIADWTFISTICRLLDCVYIDRSSDKIKESRQRIYSALEKGEVVSLFPEGTTGNGRHLLPFKSSFFSIAEEKINGEELFIQPVVINYTGIGCLPIDSAQWPFIAWYGDMVLAPHLWKLLKLAKIDASLTFLPAVNYSQFADRKHLAAYCYEAVQETLENQRRPAIS
jgi:1-acyl-sn-glycerol-3-phosphate acyltransferase